MQTYEINLWLDKKIIEKIVKQFEKDEDVLDYIAKNFDTTPDPEYPSLDPQRGYTRPKASEYILHGHVCILMYAKKVLIEYNLLKMKKKYKRH